MVIDIPADLELAIKQVANARGISTAGYVRSILERDLAISTSFPETLPLKASRGMLARYGQAPTAEEIDANRVDMFGQFGEHF